MENAQSRYARKTLVRVALNFNRNTDADILDRLSRETNQQGFFKRLVREQINQEKLMMEEKKMKKMMQTRTSVRPEDYEQARREHPEYAALCDAEDAMKAAKERLVDASVGMTGLLDAHKSLNAAIDAAIKRREEFEESIYQGVDYADFFNVSIFDET